MICTTCQLPSLKNHSASIKCFLACAPKESTSVALMLCAKRVNVQLWLRTYSVWHWAMCKLASLRKESLQAQLGCSHVVELEQQHNSLHLQHQEELLQVKTILADCYFQKIQELKSKHALELRQLRAKLSDANVKGGTSFLLLLDTVSSTVLTLFLF